MYIGVLSGPAMHCGFADLQKHHRKRYFLWIHSKNGEKSLKMPKWQGFKILVNFCTFFYLCGLLFNLYPLDDPSWSCFLGRLRCLLSIDTKHIDLKHSTFWQQTRKHGHEGLIFENFDRFNTVFYGAQIVLRHKIKGQKCSFHLIFASGPGTCVC